MNYNQFGGYPQYPQNQMERINQQMQQLQQQYQQMQPQVQNPQSNVALSNRGTYVYVNDYQEVVNYPTPADGNAVLFFNLDKGILWSKKFINGSNSIQAFAIAPLNNVGADSVNNTSSEQKAPETNADPDVIDNMLTRITSMEDKFDKLMNMLSPKQPKKETPKEV